MNTVSLKNTTHIYSQGKFALSAVIISRSTAAFISSTSVLFKCLKAQHLLTTDYLSSTIQRAPMSQLCLAFLHCMALYWGQWQRLQLTLDSSEVKNAGTNNAFKKYWQLYSVKNCLFSYDDEHERLLYVTWIVWLWCFWLFKVKDINPNQFEYRLMYHWI